MPQADEILEIVIKRFTPEILKGIIFQQIQCGFSPDILESPMPIHRIYPRTRLLMAPIFALIFISQIMVVHAGEDGKEDSFFDNLRRKMVKEQISSPPDYRDPVSDNRVLSAMLEVPRHLFVPARQASAAYGDHPLPIGYGQTISQPYIVALMTEMLEVKPDQKVLEVGTGSGYQAAILSLLARDIYTVEIVEALGRQAEDRLRRLKYQNVRVKVADGYYGWEENEPFDRIIVTCAATLIPPPLIKQLKQGGKMCIPVGGQYTVQYLTIVEKSHDGEISMRKTLPVRFVPFTRTLR